MAKPLRRRQTTGGPTPEDFVAVRLDSARRVFESDAQVARALGVDPAQVSRWRQGQAPDPLNRDRLTALDSVIEMLSGYLSPGRIRKWLAGANANLSDRSPLQTLRQGDLPGVLAAVHVLESGAHA